VLAIIVRFQVKAGHVDEVIAALNEAAGPSRNEPGCHVYIANQSLEDPNVVVMYEVYDDEAALEAHRETTHFKEIVAARVVPHLEGRERQEFRVVTPL
jgi:(4S)-4-hydroxy-5-phosphonooxypentane-2,3-dione isomerase